MKNVDDFFARKLKASAQAESCFDDMALLADSYYNLENPAMGRRINSIRVSLSGAFKIFEALIREEISHQKESEMKNEKWIVGIGGSPSDNWDEYDSEEKAQEAALKMAKEMAIENDIDPEGVDVWDSNEERGGGACPGDDDGGYWPHFCLAD